MDAALALLQARDNAKREAREILGRKEFANLAELLVSHQSERIVEYLNSLLAKAVQGNHKPLNLLLKAREAFECEACLRIASEEELCLRVVDTGNLLEAMERTVHDEEFFPKTFWELDCQFHAALVSLGNRENEDDCVSLFLQAMKETTVPYGIPSSREDMKRLHQDHVEIVDAIRDKDADRICLAIQRHIGVAYDHWLNSYRMEARIMKSDGSFPHQRELKGFVDRWKKDTGTEPSEIVKDRVRSQIDISKKYKNQYVVWVYEQLLVDGVHREIRHVLSNSTEWSDISEFVQALPSDTRDKVQIDYVEEWK